MTTFWPRRIPTAGSHSFSHMLCDANKFSQKCHVCRLVWCAAVLKAGMMFAAQNMTCGLMQETRALTTKGEDVSDAFMYKTANCMYSVMR